MAVLTISPQIWKLEVLEILSKITAYIGKGESEQACEECGQYLCPVLEKHDPPAAGNAGE